MGSLQGATGVLLRNEGMEREGREKMAREDERLGAKRGVMPVGSGSRTTEVDAVDGTGQGGMGDTRDV